MARRLIAAALLSMMVTVLPGPVHAAEPCHRVTPDPVINPTGWVGCTRLGEGVASEWGGPGTAVNACVWPWTHCQMLAVQSLTTGITIIVQPRMFCGCWTFSPDERLIDLDPAAVKALGLDPALGLFKVKVWPVDRSTGLPLTPSLPDTATVP